MNLDIKPPRHCPYLGDRQGAGGVRSYPSSRNVCHGRPSLGWGFFRAIMRPFTPVPAGWQRKFCIFAHAKCPHFQENQAASAPGLMQRNGEGLSPRPGEGKERKA